MLLLLLLLKRMLLHPRRGPYHHPWGKERKVQRAREAQTAPGHQAAAAPQAPHVRNQLGGHFQQQDKVLTPGVYRCAPLACLWLWAHFNHLPGPHISCLKAIPLKKGNQQFPTISVGLTLTMLIPQESVHVFKKGFLHQLALPSCFVLPSLLAAPVMTQFPALITETPYWVYGAFSTPSHHPACRGTWLRGRVPGKESPSPTQGRAWGLWTERGLQISSEGWGRQDHTLCALDWLLILKSRQLRRR